MLEQCNYPTTLSATASCTLTQPRIQPETVSALCGCSLFCTAQLSVIPHDGADVYGKPCGSRPESASLRVPPLFHRLFFLSIIHYVFFKPNTC